MMSYKEIDARAYKFMDDNYQDIDNGNVTNIISLAESLGFKVISMFSDTNTSGQILISNKLQQEYGTNKVIVVNACDTATRRRFTVAHELGHYCLHVPKSVKEGENAYYASRDSGMRISSEKEADEFASALLMPSKKVFDVCAKKGYLCNGVEEMIELVSKEFLVSKQAAKYRLMNLGIIND